MFKKVKYIVFESRLTTRYIDILLHYITKDDEEHGDHEKKIIEILQQLPIEFIIGIFNDPTVSYPYPGRVSYLNKKPTSTMSSILISQFIYIYHYILTNYPIIEVNPITDLTLILNQLLAIGLQDIPQIRIYRDIIKNLIQRLPDRNLFSNEWFDMLLNTLKIALQYTKSVAIERRSEFTSKSFFETIRYSDSWTRSTFNNPTSNIDLRVLFKNHNSWETYMIVDTNEINFLDTNGTILDINKNINEELIDYIRGLFNDDVGYRNKYLKYKNKYLKFKKNAVN
jgi:hypothetical protein